MFHGRSGGKYFGSDHVDRSIKDIGVRSFKYSSQGLPKLAHCTMRLIK
jgi:hypothetical protein